MNIIVMGAGVVGVTTAYWLARDGHAVTVIDRQPGPALETSFANGGQISASHAEPWANPGTPAKVLSWLGRPDAPLVFRWTRWDPPLWAWGLRFLRNCTAARERHNTSLTLSLALYSRAVLKALRADTGLVYDHRTDGILHVYRDRKEYHHACRAAETMAALGLDRTPCTPAQCAGIEPALAPVAAKLAGGLFSRDDESGDAYLFTVALAALAAGMGVAFRMGLTITGIEAQGQRVRGLATSEGPLAADAYVLALGSFSPLVARSLGLRLPIYPAKGYSITAPVTSPAATPRVSITDDEHKMVFTRLGDNLRAAGTAELAGWDLTPTPVRAQAILRNTKALFPDACDYDRAQPWAGLRPKTPDSVPILGRSPFANLYLNTGHGTLGWTMACGSARIIADLIAGREPDMAIEGLGLGRF
ncbi:MAG: D-amino acid dehydrogenase [Alphaproteobacteria bacterium]|nr:D-amino acid dehydrogenase [Alphaproteobacteria bacterium]